MDVNQKRVLSVISNSVAMPSLLQIMGLKPIEFMTALQPSVTEEELHSTPFFFFARSKLLEARGYEAHNNMILTLRNTGSIAFLGDDDWLCKFHQRLDELNEVYFLNELGIEDVKTALKTFVKKADADQFLCMMASLCREIEGIRGEQAREWHAVSNVDERNRLLNKRFRDSTEANKRVFLAHFAKFFSER